MKKERNSITIDERGNLTVPTVNGAITEIWMTEPELAELFGVIVPTIRATMKAAYKSGVLKEREVCKYVRLENGNGAEAYNMEAVASLAFRIESSGAAKLREYILRILCRADRRSAVNILIACTPDTNGCGKGRSCN